MVFQWSVRVYYEDTDAAGLVYHARYLAFYERARTEILRQYDISQQNLLHSENVAFPVRHMSIDYFSPAHLDDMLTVESEVIDVRGASITFAQRIINSLGTELSRAEVLIACIDINKRKPIAFPKSIVAEFKQ